MSSSRYLRADSPTGRRLSENPTRSSTSTLPKAYDTPRDYTTKETYTSPRASNDRVVPISKETYVNGKLVESSRDSRAPAYDGSHSDRHHYRRSTYDQDPRAPPSSSAHLRPTTLSHDDRGASADRSSTYDDRYSVSSSSSAPRKEQRRLYSIDDGKANRIPNDPELRRRDDRIVNNLKPQPDDRSRAYHLRGSTKPTTSEVPAYEYTDARGMYETTEPKRRNRRGSVDAVARDRPTSMIDPYQTGPRLSARELGPPPSKRGYDKFNDPNLLSRTSSLQASYKRSPSRTRGYTTSAYNDDENYRVPPRISTRRDDSEYSSGPRSAGLLSPTRGGAGDYYEPRRRSRFEDSDVASRGFGIRAPSVDARSSADSGVDKHGTYTDEPLMIEAPPPSCQEYPIEPRAAVKEDTRLREPDWREPERQRERERDLPRSPCTSPPRDRETQRERDLVRDRDRGSLATDRERDPIKDRERGPPPTERERDVIRDRERGSVPTEREREYGPRDSNKSLEDSRRDRDYDHDYLREQERHRTDREREPDRYSDEGRYARDRHQDPEYDEARRERDRRSDRLPTDEHQRERDRRDFRDEPERHDHHHAAEAIAGTAAAGAAAFGAKEMHDRRQREDRRDQFDDLEPVRKAEVKDARPTQPGSREMTSDQMPSEREPSKQHDMDDDDVSEPRRRNYVSKEKAQETFASIPSKHSEILDPEEDYRRRVQQVQQEMGRAPPQHEHDADRERRRREHSEARESNRHRDDHGPSEEAMDRSVDSQALTRYDTQDNEITASPSEEPSESSEASEARRKKRVSIVDPIKESKAPKSILRKPTNKFPEDPNPIREGVAPLKDAKASSDKSIPTDARWTKIARAIVNPLALEEKGERFEEREDYVVVLRVLDKETVQKYADRTKAIRDARYAERKQQEHKDHGDHRSVASDRDHGSHHDHDHDRRDRERGKDSEREREHDGQDRGRDGAGRYKPEGY